jgi:hypothetical protein
MRKDDSKIINDIFIDSNYDCRGILISHKHLYEYGIGYKGLSITNMKDAVDGVDKLWFE